MSSVNLNDQGQPALIDVPPFGRSHLNTIVAAVRVQTLCISMMPLICFTFICIQSMNIVSKSVWVGVTFTIWHHRQTVKANCQLLMLHISFCIPQWNLAYLHKEIDSVTHTENAMGIEAMLTYYHMVPFVVNNT